MTPYLDAFETSREVSVDGYSYLQDPPSAAPPPTCAGDGRNVRRCFRLSSPSACSCSVCISSSCCSTSSALPLQVLRPAWSPQPRHRPPHHRAKRSSRRAPCRSNRRRPAKRTPHSQPPLRRKRPRLPRASPKSAGPSRFIRRISLRLTLRHPAPTARWPPKPIACKSSRCGKPFCALPSTAQSEPAFNGWLDPADPPLTFRGRHLTVKVLERGAVQITKNGAALAADDTDVTFE